MLENYKKIYTQMANLIPGLKEKNKNDLIKQYCIIKDTGNEKTKNAYMAAIILKYWGALNRFYGKSNNSKIKAEDCYNWLIEAIMEITTHPHLFNEPKLYFTYKKTGETRIKDNPIYNNPDGPNIAMIKCLSSMRAGFYQSSNYDMRKLNYTENNSIEDLIEAKKDYILPSSNNIEDNLSTMFINNLIKEYFSNKDYYKAFVLDGILNGDIFDKGIFNKKKLVKHLRSFDNNYCIIISNMFNLNRDEIIREGQMLKKLNSNKLYITVDSVLALLKRELENALN